MTVQEMSSIATTEGKAKYMCSWAFEFLRTEPACIGMDFRLFHELLKDIYQHGRIDIAVLCQLLRICCPGRERCHEVKISSRK